MLAANRSPLRMLGPAAMLFLLAGLAKAQYAQRGRVVMWNGDPLPGIAQVEMVCPEGKTYMLAVTNADGYFTPGIGLMADASERDSKDRPKYMTNCQMRAILPGYVSTTTSSRQIMLFPPTKSKGGSSATALVPAGSRKAFERGLKAMEGRDLESAEQYFQQAVQIYDQNVGAWYLLGKIYQELEKPDEARQALLHAVAADPQNVDLYNDLYQLAFERDDMEDLLQQTETLLRLNPYEFPEAYYYNAVANLQLKHYEAGEERIRTVIQNFPDYEQPLEYYVLGFLLANQGRSAEALETFETFLTFQPEGDSAQQAREAIKTLERRLDQQGPAGAGGTRGTGP